MFGNKNSFEKTNQGFKNSKGQRTSSEGLDSAVISMQDFVLNTTNLSLMINELGYAFTKAAENSRDNISEDMMKVIANIKAITTGVPLLLANESLDSLLSDPGKMLDIGAMQMGNFKEDMSIIWDFIMFAQNKLKSEASVMATSIGISVAHLLLKPQVNKEVCERVAKAIGVYASAYLDAIREMKATEKGTEERKDSVEITDRNTTAGLDWRSKL